MTTTQTASAQWPEVPDLVGRRFVSPWLEVSAIAVEHFGEAAYLSQVEPRLDLSVYPDGLIEGFHLLALLDHLVGQVSYVESARWEGWNYGLDRVRFTHAVTTSDRVRVEGEISRVDPRGSAMLITYDCEMRVDGIEKPALVATWKVLWSLNEEEEVHLDQ